MDTDKKTKKTKKHEIPISETKDFITHSNSSSQSISIFHKLGFSQFSQ